MQSKSDLRKYAKNLRASLDIKAQSAQILRILTGLEIYKNAETIMAYYPFGSEPDIKPLFNDKSKKFYIPKITGDNDMIFPEYESENDLKENKYNIKEPQNTANITNADLMILPALMADKNGFRLGYGKGYYDRFLNKNNFTGKKIILIPDELLTEKLPTDKYDIASDFVITQNEVLKII